MHGIRLAGYAEDHPAPRRNKPSLIAISIRLSLRGHRVSEAEATFDDPLSQLGPVIASDAETHRNQPSGPSKVAAALADANGLAMTSRSNHEDWLHNEDAASHLAVGQRVVRHVDLV
jgi:hypothetical protein